VSAIPDDDPQFDRPYVEVPIFFGRRRWVRSDLLAPTTARTPTAPSRVGPELIGRVHELHALLHQAQEQIQALTANQERRPRWQFWRRPTEGA
jgi:hypothetical protein